MAQSGLNSGMYKGLHQGVKTGFGMSNIRSGMHGGVVNGIFDKSKVQNPLNLVGAEKPIMYGCADFCTGEGTSQLTMDDIANTGKTFITNISSSNRPIQTPNKIGSKDALVYANATSQLNASAAPISSGRSAITLMMVCKMSGGQNTWLASTNSITAGALDITALSTDVYTINSNFYYGTSAFSTYRTLSPSPNYMRDYMILTLKYKISNLTGTGSEQEIYVNGRLAKYASATTFTPGVSTFTMAALGIGNNPGSGPANATNFELGSVILFDYFLNETEQLRLENYFRQYYGINF
jgi:hypothetical protein